MGVGIRRDAGSAADGALPPQPVLRHPGLHIACSLVALGAGFREAHGLRLESNSGFVADFAPLRLVTGTDTVTAREGLADVLSAAQPDVVLAYLASWAAPHGAHLWEKALDHLAHHRPGKCGLQALSPTHVDIGPIDHLLAHHHEIRGVTEAPHRCVAVRVELPGRMLEVVL